MLVRFLFMHGSACAMLSAAVAAHAADGPGAPFIPTPPAVVAEMLRVASVGASDVVYDLGSGDGRIVIAAAKEHGARGVGIERDPELVARAVANAERAGVADRVKFVRQDLFQADLAEATVIALYLLPAMNDALRPRLQGLRPGTRIVSHDFAMDDWEPDHVSVVQGKRVYLWIVRGK
ncbi:MAG: methyltransferase domain-containing protein [Burkholderiales bacterium]|nr:methyltransferase domain-containing protein [Burkholderiales bacterium]